MSSEWIKLRTDDTGSRVVIGKKNVTDVGHRQRPEGAHGGRGLSQYAGGHHYIMLLTKRGCQECCQECCQDCCQDCCKEIGARVPLGKCLDASNFPLRVGANFWWLKKSHMERKSDRREKVTSKNVY
jgi:hypothetical protein